MHDSITTDILTTYKTSHIAHQLHRRYRKALPFFKYKTIQMSQQDMNINATKIFCLIHNQEYRTNLHVYLIYCHKSVSCQVLKIAKAQSNNKKKCS